MDKKKINLSFGVVVIALLVIFYIIINDFSGRRAADFKEYAVSVANIVNMKNNKIKMLAYQIALRDKEIQSLKNTLAETRNSLDALSKKLAQPAPAGAPEPAPAVK